MLSLWVAPQAQADIVHFATSSNTSGNAVYLMGETNQQHILMATPVWNIGGGSGIYDNHNIGVSWNLLPNRQWSIFNQDGMPMPLGAAFNVWSGMASSTVFTYYANTGNLLLRTPGNIVGNSVYLDTPVTNGNPNALVFVTPNWSPNGFAGIYLNHPIGVWFDSSRQKWAIFNQDGAAMPNGAAFNVVVQTPGAVCFTHRATTSNIILNWTDIDSPLTNGKSNAYVFVTSNFNLGGPGGVLNSHPIGVWFDNSRQKWAIFNQDLAAMPVGASFNVWVIPENGDLASLTLAQSQLLGPAQLGGIVSTSATVTLDQPAPEGGAVIQLSSNNPAVAWAGDSSGHSISSITIPSGAQSGSFWVYTHYGPPVTFTASYRGISRQATVSTFYF